MGKSLFIFNSKRSFAILATIALISLNEAGLLFFNGMSPDFYGGTSTTWTLVKKIEQKRFAPSAVGVILGDSTAGVLGQRLEPEGVHNFALKIWDGMPGQYFLLKKYLQSGGRPQVCLLVSDLRLWRIQMKTAYDWSLAADSFFRPLWSVDAIADLALGARRPDLARQMFLEGTLPSRRFRIPVTNALAKLGIYKVDKHQVNPLEQNQANLEGDNLVSEEKLSDLSRYYFRKLKALCLKYQIQLVVIESPLNKERLQTEPGYQEGLSEVSQFLEREKVQFQMGQIFFPRDSFDADGVHLAKEESRAQFAAQVKELVDFYGGRA